MKKLLPIALLMLAACGSPAKQTTPLPNMAGTWTGSIDLPNEQTANLNVVLTENTSGYLTGTASSTEGCSFNLPVTGHVYSTASFGVVTADETTLLLDGNLQANMVSAIGHANINGNTGCLPQNDASFQLAKQ
jgi:hypothetical protein